MSLNEKAYLLILEELRTGELPPGSMITESQIVQRLDLTLAPVRSALARLSQEGWLIPVPRRGYRVKPLTISDIRDLFLVRKMVEPVAARMAAKKIDAEHLAKLDKVCALGFVPGDTECERAFFEANKAFHLGIVEAVGSRRLYEIVRSLHDESERVLRYGMQHLNWSEGWAHGHEDLLAALVNGDGEEAERTALRQLETSENVLMQILLREAEDLPLGHK